MRSKSRCFNPKYHESLFDTKSKLNFCSLIDDFGSFQSFSLNFQSCIAKVPLPDLDFRLTSAMIGWMSVVGLVY